MPSKKEVVELPALEPILAAVDFEKVSAAIITEENGTEVKMYEFDFQDARRLIKIAAEKYLARDLFEIDLEGLELKQTMEVERQRLPFKGFLDLAGTCRGLIDPFKPFAGKRIVVDWKTSKNTLGTDWKNRLLDSLQWMCYAEVYQGSIFCYRGLSRTGETKEVIIPTPESNGREVFEYLTAVGDQVNALRAGGFEVYPRNMPHACGAYGRDCPYLLDCKNYMMPRAPLSEDKQLSYSFCGTFLLCPERARRDSLNEDSLDSEESSFGKAVHRGLAELWRQAYDIRKKLS